MFKAMVLHKVLTTIASGKGCPLSYILNVYCTMYIAILKVYY